VAHRPVSPVILSASRVTDIPAFFMPWFLNRLQQGYSVRVNPYNKKRNRISYENVRAIVFWSKNPGPLLSSAKALEETGLGFYLHFTLNDYEQEGWEPGLPSLKDRVELFKQLSSLLGKKRVIWRFDPLAVSSSLSAETLGTRIISLGDRLATFTDRMVVSFLDVTPYSGVRRRLEKNPSFPREVCGDEEIYLKETLSKAQQRWRSVNPDFTVTVCAEGDWEKWGIAPAACIDGTLLSNLYPGDEQLAGFLKKVKKDPSQRPLCRCIESRDIGAYGTCRYGCLYCYARYNRHPISRDFTAAESLSDVYTDEKRSLHDSSRM